MTLRRSSNLAKVYIIGQNLKDNAGILPLIGKISQESQIILKKIKTTAHKIEITTDFFQGEKLLKIIHKEFFEA